MAHSIESAEFWKSKVNGFNNRFISNVCRLCANICDNLVPIFDKIHDKGSIHFKLKKCLPSISVLENDIKPKQICISCVSKLELCFSFIEMCLDTDCKFEATLQSNSTAQIQVVNNNLMNKALDFSWMQSKQEPTWSSLKQEPVQMAKSDQKMSQVILPELSNQIYQQKPYQQIIQVPPPTSNQFSQENRSNLGVVLNKQDVNHNILPSVSVSDGLSSQDLILLVELKCKDNTSVLPVKKNDLPGQNTTQNKITEMNNYQTKIMDTNSNVRLVNNSNLCEKFNISQSDKATSTFINDNASAASILKALESEVFNGVIKLENMNGESVTLNEPLKTNLNTNFDNASVASTSNVDSMKVTSQQPVTRDFECTVCGKLFSRRNRLNAHLARHSSVRPHSCDKCDQRFITRWDLTLHLRIHSGVFSCEFCGKAFPAKGKLERHRRTHTGERPFPCELCNKAFSEKRNLENHLKTHAAAEARKATATTNTLCLTCRRNFISNGVGVSMLKSKCESCEKKDIFDIFVDSNASNLTNSQCDVFKCTSDEQNNHSDSGATSNIIAEFLKT